MEPRPAALRRLCRLRCSTPNRGRRSRCSTTTTLADGSDKMRRDFGRFGVQTGTDLAHHLAHDVPIGPSPLSKPCHLPVHISPLSTRRHPRIDHRPAGVVGRSRRHPDRPRSHTPSRHRHPIHPEPPVRDLRMRTLARAYPVNSTPSNKHTLDHVYPQNAEQSSTLTPCQQFWSSLHIPRIRVVPIWSTLIA